MAVDVTGRGSDVTGVLDPVAPRGTFAPPEHVAPPAPLARPAADDGWAPPLVGAGTTGRLRRVVLLTGGALVAVMLGGAGWVAYELAELRDQLDGRILPGVEIGGVDVSGMTRDEALGAVEATLAPQLQRPISMWWADQSWTTTPAALGSTSDAPARIGEAVAASTAPSWEQLARMRFLDEGLGMAAGVTVTHSAEGARAWVAEVGASIDRPTRDAAMDFSTGWITFTPAETGIRTLVDATTTNLVRTLTEAGGGTGPARVRLGVLETQPAVTAADMDRVLLVRQSENRLYLYESGAITHEYLVTTGTGNYPTPTGEFTIGLKRPAPTWVNPDPDGWGADMPESIGPGPGNPLGLRALNWVDAEGNDDGIRFHGTQNVADLGGTGSHGCVRLSNADVVELYELVEVGDRIVSLG